MIAWLARWRVVLFGAALWRAMLLGLLTAGCSAFGAAPETQPSLWGSDGCSNSPDLGRSVQRCDDHDLCYRTGGYDGRWTERGRWVCDLDLLRGLLIDGQPSPLARAYYEGVRHGGGPAWARNRERARAP